MTQIIDTSGTTAGNDIVAGEGYENIYVAEGVTRSATPGHAIYSQYIGTEVMVNGNLYGDSDCISLVNSSGDLGDFNINVSNTGSVIGDGDGISVADSDNTISNNGEIVGMDGHGVNNNGNNFSFSNAGTVTSHSNDAVYCVGNDASVMNHGLIQSLSTAPSINAIVLLGANAMFTNDGTVSAAGGTAYRSDYSSVDKVWNFGAFDGGVRQGGGNVYKNSNHLTVAAR